MKRSRKYLTAAAAVAVVLVGLSLASAAGLSLSGGSISAVAATHPCLGTASAVAANLQTGTNYLSVVVAMPSGCAGRQVQVHVDRPNTTTDRNGVGSADASGVAAIRLDGTFSTGVTNVLSATVDGWPLPVAWNTTLMPPIWCTVLDSSTATCVATVTIFTGTRPGGTSSATYYDVVVTTTSTSNVLWEVGFNLDHAYYGSRATSLGNSTLDGYNDGGTNWTTNDVTRHSACSAIPLLLVRGDDTGGTNNFENVVNNGARRFSLVVNRTEAGYSDVVWPGCGAP